MVNVLKEKFGHANNIVWGWRNGEFSDKQLSSVLYIIEEALIIASKELPDENQGE